MSTEEKLNEALRITRNNGALEALTAIAQIVADRQRKLNIFDNISVQEVSTRKKISDVYLQLMNDITNLAKNYKDEEQA